MLQLRPTCAESWYRVVNLKARLRPSAQISRQYYRGERWYVVRDPAGNQDHRLSDAAYRFVGLLDGSRTVGEAWDLVGGTRDDEAPTQPEVSQILGQPARVGPDRRLQRPAAPPQDAGEAQVAGPADEHLVPAHPDLGSGPGAQEVDAGLSLIHISEPTRLL